MRTFIKKRSIKSGLPPGTLIHIGEKKLDEVKINVMDYDENHVTEKEIKDLNECFAFKELPSITWIDIEGLHDIDLLEKLGNYFGLHPLVLEDILNTDHRPKLEEFDNYVYIVLKMFHMKKSGNEVIPEQVSIILGRNFVITFQEGIEGDSFNIVRERIRNGKGKINRMSADYLVYSLIDSIIDTYFLLLENFGEKIERLEEELVTSPERSTLKTIYELKREMLFLRKSVWPLREAISRLERGESELITESTHIYIRDVYDHTINILDTIETYRDMLSGMIDIYLSSISNKLNEVMKYLALISTIFIPMTFIASIYGMNFNHMPELDWLLGYPFALGIMLAVGITLLIYFKKKKWT